MKQNLLLLLLLLVMISAANSNERVTPLVISEQSQLCNRAIWDLFTLKPKQLIGRFPPSKQNQVFDPVLEETFVCAIISGMQAKPKQSLLSNAQILKR